MGNFPSLFLATVGADGQLEYCDGTISIIDGAGNTIAHGLDPARYFTYLGEASEDYSFIKFPFYRPRSDIPSATIGWARWRVSMWRDPPGPRVPTSSCANSNSAARALARESVSFPYCAPH